MSKKKNILLRISALLLAGLLSVTSVNVTAFSAPINKNENNYTTDKLTDELEIQVQDAYKALMKAYKTGREADFIAACKLVARLTPTQCVRLFVLKYQDFYKKNYLNEDFKLFDVNAYLLKHPELIDTTHSIEHNNKKALEHYLEYGIYKAESSCTEFDPIVAIIVQPNACIAAIVNDKDISFAGLDSIKTAYANAEGVDNTLDYDLSSSFKEASKANDKFIADDGILSIRKKTGHDSTVVNATKVDDNKEQIIDSEKVNEDNNKENTNDTPVVNPSVSPSVDPTDDEEDGKGAPGDEPYELINKNAAQGVQGYRLYATSNEVPEGSTAVTLNDRGNTITYYPGTYNSLSDDIKNKSKYTVMMYLCGSDLESNEGVTVDDILNALRSRYDINDINVLLCIGGSNLWHSNYLRNDEVNSNNNSIRSSVYLLDPTAITDEQAKDINLIDTDQRNTLINSDTLKLLSHVENPIEMGQSELLLGFMDMAYELFPADNYWLSLWNHGGGSKKGICFSDGYVDEKYEITGQGLTLARIEEALSNSNICNVKGKIDILSMDACMMSGAEVAYNLSPYVNYLVASAENTNGDVRYDIPLDYINESIAKNNINNKDIAKVMAEVYVNNRSESIQNLPNTNAAFDLSGIDEVKGNINQFATNMNALLSDQDVGTQVYRLLRQASVRSKAYGSDMKYGAWDYLDIYDFLYKVDEYIKDFKANNTLKTSEQTACENISTAINNVLNKKFIVSGGVTYGLSKDIRNVADNSQVLLSLAEVAQNRHNNTEFIYNKEFDNYISGLNIFFPTFNDGYLYYDKNLTFNEEGNDNYLKEKVLEDYTKLIENYEKVSRSEAEMARLSKIAEALSKGDYDHNLGIENIVINHNAYTTEDFDNNSQENETISIKFRDNYVPKDISGNENIYLDPYADFMSVVDKVKVAATKNEVLVDASGEHNIDIIVGQIETYPYMGISSAVKYDPANRTIKDDAELIFNITNNNILGYSVSGVKYKVKDGEMTPVEGNYFDWAYKKNDALSIDEIREIFENHLYSENDVLVFDGRYYVTVNEAGTVNDGYLCFQRDAETYSTLNYIGTVNMDRKKVEGEYAVDFYHYGMVNNETSIKRIEDLVDLENPDNKYSLKNAPVYVIDATNPKPVITECILNDGNNSKIIFEAEVVLPTDGESKKVSYIAIEGDAPAYNKCTEAEYQAVYDIGAEITSGSEPPVLTTPSEDPIAACKSIDNDETSIDENNIDETDTFKNEDTDSDIEELSDEEIITLSDDDSIIEEDNYIGSVTNEDVYKEDVIIEVVDEEDDDTPDEADRNDLATDGAIEGAVSDTELTIE